MQATKHSGPDADRFVPCDYAARKQRACSCCSRWQRWWVVSYRQVSLLHPALQTASTSTSCVLLAAAHAPLQLLARHPCLDEVSAGSCGQLLLYHLFNAVVLRRMPRLVTTRPRHLRALVVWQCDSWCAGVPGWMWLCQACYLCCTSSLSDWRSRAGCDRGRPWHACGIHSIRWNMRERSTVIVAPMWAARSILGCRVLTITVTPADKPAIACGTSISNTPDTLESLR